MGKKEEIIIEGEKVDYKTHAEWTSHGWKPYEQPDNNGNNVLVGYFKVSEEDPNTLEEGPGAEGKTLFVYFDNYTYDPSSDTYNVTGPKVDEAVAKTIEVRPYNQGDGLSDLLDYDIKDVYTYENGTFVSQNEKNHEESARQAYEEAFSGNAVKDDANTEVEANYGYEFIGNIHAEIDGEFIVVGKHFYNAQLNEESLGPTISEHYYKGYNPFTGEIDDRLEFDVNSRSESYKGYVFIFNEDDYQDAKLLDAVSIGYSDRYGSYDTQKDDQGDYHVRGTTGAYRETLKQGDLKFDVEGNTVFEHDLFNVGKKSALDAEYNMVSGSSEIGKMRGRRKLKPVDQETIDEKSVEYYELLARKKTKQDERNKAQQDAHNNGLNDGAGSHGNYGKSYNPSSPDPIPTSPLQNNDLSNPAPNKTGTNGNNGGSPSTQTHNNSKWFSNSTFKGEGCTTNISTNAIYDWQKTDGYKNYVQNMIKDKDLTYNVDSSTNDFTIKRNNILKALGLSGQVTEGQFQAALCGADPNDAALKKALSEAGDVLAAEAKKQGGYGKINAGESAADNNSVSDLSEVIRATNAVVYGGGAFKAGTLDAGR